MGAWLIFMTLGITVAAYNLGCLSGAVPTIWIGNYLGRRKTIFVGSSVMIIGAILQAASYSLPQLIVGRIVTGFGRHLPPYYRRQSPRLTPLQVMA